MTPFRIDARPTQRLTALLGLALLMAGLLVAVLRGLGGDGAEPQRASTGSAGPPAASRPAKARPKPRARPRSVRVRIVAAGSFDPEGDGAENEEEAALAVDGNAATAWSTERYDSFFKSGVGLVLDAGRRVAVRRVGLTSDTPGFAAEIRLGTRPEGPFARVGPARPIAGRAVFSFRPRRARYVVVWVVEIPDNSAAHVNEVRVTARR